MAEVAASKKQPVEATVHPLVLLSVVDHYTRLNAGATTGKRVVGVLLGSVKNGVVDVSNSFAVPFDEDPHSPNVFFLDHNFLETMFGMFRKVNAKEVVVGWYSTGPKIRPNDLDIHQLLRKFCTHPVYCIIEVEPKELGIPVSSYVVHEEVEDENSQPKLTFRHIPSSIDSIEAEEIGVEHLLRDVSEHTVTTLGTQTKDKIDSLRGLYEKLTDMHEYLVAVGDGKLPVNHNVLYKLQDMFNILPLLHHQTSQVAMTVQTNDDYMAMYVASMMRTVLALHDLIINKQDLVKQTEQRKKDKEKKEKERKEKEAKEKEEKAAKEKKEKEEKEKKEKEEKEDSAKMDEDKPASS